MRRVLRLCLSGIIAATGAAVLAAAAFSSATAGASVASPAMSEQWDLCNARAVSSAPKVVFARIEEVESTHRVPASFWTNVVYRRDVARIVCYESTYDVHARNATQFGWFQMTRSLISSEGVSWPEYWSGSSSHPPGWYQALAGELYIARRYVTPAAAWAHERNYGWY